MTLRPDSRRPRTNRPSGGSAVAAENIANPQQQFAWFERLGKVVVYANLQSLYPVIRFGTSGEHQNGDVLILAQGLRELEPGLTGHHDIENQQIKCKATHGAARCGRMLGGCDAKPVFVKKTGQQVANALIVIDDQNMRRIVCDLYGAHSLSCG